MSWKADGPEQIIPGVYRLPLPIPERGLGAVNVYAIEDGGGVTLVDAGWDDSCSRAALDTQFNELGFGVADVRQVLVTHLHQDHIGQAAQFRREAGAHVALGESEDTSLKALLTGASVRGMQASHISYAGADDIAERVMTELGPEVSMDLEPPDAWLRPNDIIDLQGSSLRVVPTPGHTRGHVCFVDDERALLFSGDHVLPRITPSIGFEVPPAEASLATFLRSLARIRPLHGATVMPAHGPIFDDLGGRVDELIAHHDVRLSLCRRELCVDAVTARRVAAALPWTRRETPFRKLSTYNQLLAVWETLAHLELLAAQGDAVIGMQDGVATFTALPRDSSQ